MAFGDSDIAYMLVDFGVPVVFNGVTVNGIIDEFDQRETAASQWLDLVDRIRRVTIKTGSLPGIVNESLLTVDGNPYSVRDIIQEHDGGLTSLYCIKQIFAPFPFAHSTDHSSAYA